VQYSPRQHRLTDAYVRKLALEAKPYLVWDNTVLWLAVAVYPAGTKAWKCIYPYRSRTRWYSIAKVGAVNADNARKLAADILLRVAKGEDPAAAKRAERSARTFDELHAVYVEHIKTKNKSWTQGAKLIWKHMTPRLGKHAAASITRAEIKNCLAHIKSDSVRTQTLRVLSPIFTWLIKEDVITSNPCQKIGTVVGPSRERVLSDAELPLFWKAFDDAGLLRSTALKAILLTGQRPGEVSHMRWEHVREGWWELPGSAVPALGWPGTKNKQTHRVWLPKAARDLISDLTDDGETPESGFVFANERRSAVNRLDEAMRGICKTLKVEKLTPHDLRRSHGSTIPPPSPTMLSPAVGAITSIPPQPCSAWNFRQLRFVCLV
jgi:integrase